MSVSSLTSWRAAGTLLPAACLLLVFVSVVSASVLQEGYPEGPYEEDSSGGPDSYGYGAEQPHHREEPYDGPNAYREDGHHEGGVVGICLQAFNYEWAENHDYVMAKFRCCGPEDAPDVCLHNNTYPAPHKKDWRHDDSASFLDTVLNPETAAVCKLNFDAVPCPVVGGNCSIYEVECTLNKHASACNCPFEDGVTLKATLYGTPDPVEVLTCTTQNLLDQKRHAPVASQPAVAKQGSKFAAQRHPAGTSTGTVYHAYAVPFQGAIEFVGTPFGAVERKGTIQYIERTGAHEVVTGPLPDLPFVRAGQMMIRLWEQKY